MQKKQKLCWNCEGNVSVEALYCPFCGSDLHQHEVMEKDYALSSKKETTSSYPQEQTNLASLYTPPYRPTHSGFGVPSYQEESTNIYEEEAYPEEETSYSRGQEAVEEAPQKVDVGIWPLLFLSIGSNLLTIGLLLFFFSDKGKVVLEWNSYFWFVYCILATPILMFGWKLLQSQKN